MVETHLHALALSSTDVIERAALPAAVLAIQVPRPLPSSTESGVGRRTHASRSEAAVLHDFERRYVTLALERARGNLTEAAIQSGLNRSNFRRVLARLGLDASAFRDA